MPALAFLEECAALRQQRSAVGSQMGDQLSNHLAPPGATAATSGGAPDVQAVWERDSWLRKGQRMVVMRLNGVKVVPVRLNDYLTDELRALARHCLLDC